MTSLSKLLLVFATLLALTACGDPDHYPVSGEECGPDDPVLDLDTSVADCTPNI